MMKIKKIQIVEDEAITSILLKLEFEKAGFVVCTNTSNGLDALRVFEQETPDLILMDIRLSGSMDGIETARHIRKKSDIAILFMTGYIDDQLYTEIKEVDALDCLIKPIQVNQVIAVIP